MNIFKSQFEHNVRQHPDSPAIADGILSISYQQLATQIQRLQVILEDFNCHQVAIVGTNCAGWIALDLACVYSQITTIPIPHFFSKSQIAHTLSDANVDTVLFLNSNEEEASSIKLHILNATQIEQDNGIELLDQYLLISQLKTTSTQTQLPKDCLKISYTSGTTSEPKGVLISALHVDNVISSLVIQLQANAKDRHLSVLPFSLLLENIAGIYAVLSAGGCCMVPSFDEIGLTGSSSLDVGKFIQTIQNFAPTTMITVPAFAKALVLGYESLGLKNKSLRFIAVGGAPLSKSIIQKANELELPLFQGYGLTECSSVVSINTQSNHKPNSVGKPLPHVDVSISDEGEIVISGATSSGYLHTDNQIDTDAWETGDLGYLDDDGYLYITGRKRTTYCTAYGRNISPEWVESELLSDSCILQAMLFGEGMPFNVAIIVARPDSCDESLKKSISMINQRLPDYAQIGQWIKASEPYSTYNRQLSSSGTLVRHQILNDYQSRIEQIYQ